MTQAISLIILLISTSIVTPGVEAADDEVKDTAVCTTQSQTLKLDCGDAAKIEMVSGYYAHDKSDRACSAGGPHWESNSCMQFSDTLGEKLKDECNGQSSCDVGSGAYDPYNFSEDIPTEWYDCSLDKRIEPGQAKSRNVVGARYKCIKYEFCKEFSGKHSTLKVTSENYPENSVTNPTCGCTFSRAQGTGVFVKLFMECKASMTVTTVETFSNGTSMEREYLCGGGPYTLIGGSKIASIELKADPSRSPEHSAYFVTAAMYSSEDLRLVQAEVEVSCVAGKLYLPYSTQLGLMIGLPLLVIFLVAAIVLYCICKNRRYKEQEERLHYQLEARRHHESMEAERHELAADGKSTSSTADQPEPWHSNPEVSPTNELEGNGFDPRRAGSVRNYLHHSSSAIPRMRSDDKLSRSRHSVRSYNKRKAPRPPGPPPPALLPTGIAAAAFLTPTRNIEDGERTPLGTPKKRNSRRNSPSAPSLSDEDYNQLHVEVPHRTHSQSPAAISPSTFSLDSDTPLCSPSSGSIKRVPSYYSDSPDSVIHNRRKNTDFNPGDDGDILLMPKGAPQRHGEQDRYRRGSIGSRSPSMRRHYVPINPLSDDSDTDMTIMRPNISTVCDEPMGGYDQAMGGFASNSGTGGFDDNNQGFGATHDSGAFGEPDF